MNVHVISVWVLPVILAITFHEAAHAYTAWHLGDETAKRLGRVSLNPLKHIDPFGTVLLPGFLIFSGAPFLFGYARPVPVNFGALRNPRRDMILVALAGPLTNILLALVAALCFHLLIVLPQDVARWVAANLRNMLVLNILLAVFNMLPIPPLDGGRVAVGLLPKLAATRLAQVAPYGILIVLAVLLVLPMIGRQIGVDLNVVPRALRDVTDYLIRAIIYLAGLAR